MCAGLCSSLYQGYHLSLCGRGQSSPIVPGFHALHVCCLRVEGVYEVPHVSPVDLHPDAVVGQVDLGGGDGQGLGDEGPVPDGVGPFRQVLVLPAPLDGAVQTHHLADVLGKHQSSVVGVLFVEIPAKQKVFM